MMSERESRGMQGNFQQFLQHALDCLDPNCILPLCVNIKLKLKHSQVCRKKTNCVICQEMKALASKHCEQCVDYYCRVPFCMEAKLETFNTDAHIDIDGNSDGLLQEKISGLAQKEEKVTLEKIVLPNCPPLGNFTSPLNPLRQRGSPSYIQGPRQSPSHNAQTQMPALIFSESPSFDSISYSSCPRLERSLGNRPMATKRTEIAISRWSDNMEPYLVSKQRCLTTSTQETSTGLFVEQQVTSAAIGKDLAISSVNTEKSTQVKQIDQNVNRQQSTALDAVRASVCQRVVRTSRNTPRLKHLSLNSIQGRENNTKGNLSKVSLMDALYGIMRHVLNTKSRKELLVSFGLLRSALAEIKRLDSSTKQ